MAIQCLQMVPQMVIPCPQIVYLYHQMDIQLTERYSSEAKENDENSSVEVGAEKKKIDGEPQEEQPVDNVKTHPEIEENPIDTDTVPGDMVVAKETSNLVVEENPSKCWGDYSDSEAEVIEVAS
ncbi:protein TSS [Prunus yedoensis var. nudiflora]|uniref:Protein TSS n=1 Tax=Prunus yedoensis var. nudiflora TaxID=2094558 RepID=A0A314YS30_PRUYE|nr:protein TSS [Prunus yedoensis var. nudiflora]